MPSRIYGGSATISQLLNMNPKLLTPGEPAPDFELKDINGDTIRLSSFRGKKPVVLAFLRGFM